MVDYSVIIRTTGKAGEKYAQLLGSIEKLNPQPQEIIVVLPEGYAPPKESLGKERICYCPKGMVTQRLYGIRECTTRYALITDDDIAFESDFVSKLYVPLADGKYGFSAGPLTEFFPEPGAQTICSALIGAALPAVFHRERYNTVLKTTGYSFNRKIAVGSNRLYETQSAPWTCFFADMEAIQAIHFEDELWLDKHGYSAHDDTTMFYKAWLCGRKAVIVADAPYQHLDAGTSRRGNSENVEFSNGFNTIVFWHRFLYTQEKGLKKAWCQLCLKYRIQMQKIYNYLNIRRGKMVDSEAAAFCAGVAEGKAWISSSEYAAIPPIKY